MICTPRIYVFSKFFRAKSMVSFTWLKQHVFGNHHLCSPINYKLDIFQLRLFQPIALLKRRAFQDFLNQYRVKSNIKQNKLQSKKLCLLIFYQNIFLRREKVRLFLSKVLRYPITTEEKAEMSWVSIGTIQRIGFQHIPCFASVNISQIIFMVHFLSKCSPFVVEV